MATATSFTEDLYVLLTRKYNPDYKHLDNHEFVGTMTYGSDPTRPDTSDNSYECNVTEHYIARVEPVSPHIRVSVIKKAIEDHFRTGCSCEHDCCGHSFGGVRQIKYLGDGHLYSITCGYARNY